MNIKKILIDIYYRLDIYWYDLNHYEENTPREIKAKKDIVDMIIPFNFAVTLLFFNYFFVKIEKIENVAGSSFIFFGTTVIYLIWVFIIIKFRRKNK
jgi:hypothetical protein